MIDDFDKKLKLRNLNILHKTFLQFWQIQFNSIHTNIFRFHQPYFIFDLN